MADSPAAPLDDTRFRVLLELIPDALVICDASGRMVAANQQVQDLLGWAPAALVGQPIEMLVPDHARDDHTAHRIRYLQDPANVRPKGTSRRLAARRADGSELPVDIYLSTTTIDGELFTAATVRDATERWRTEDALRASDAAIATSVTGIVFAGVDGRIDYVNDAFLKMWGFDAAAEVLGHDTSELWVDEEVAQEVARALRYHGSWIGELTARRRDGDHRQVQLSANLVLDAAGHPIRMMAAILDVSELRMAQERLHERERQLQTIVANLPVVISAFDSTGRVLLSDGRGLERLGQAPGEMVGRLISDVYPDVPNLREAFELARAGESVSFTTRVGDLRFEIVFAPLRTSADPNGVIGVGFDITERHLAEQALALSEAQLRQSQKMEAIGQLAGGIAHDFNNLLTVVRGYTEILLEQFVEGDPRRVSCDEIRRAAERASTLTRQLLAFSRRQMLQPKVINLNAVVGDMQRMLTRVIGEDVTLTVSLQPGLWNVKADPGQLEQILVNLAVNARDAMPRGGTLRLTTANGTTTGATQFRDFTLPAGEWVRLQVTDTGHGMDASTLRRIFEPFFTTKNPGQGTGLGLATVYGIVKQSEGFISAISAPDAGTTFEIYLPHATEPMHVEPPAAAHGPGGSETILLVEDEEGVRDLARLFLESGGYRVLEATDGRDALRVAGSYPGPIHVLVTDVVMPHMDGPALVARLGPERPDMKILYISGYTEDAVVLRGGSRQSAALLQKPFSRPALLESVARALGR